MPQVSKKTTKHYVVTCIRWTGCCL